MKKLYLLLFFLLIINFKVFGIVYSNGAVHSFDDRSLNLKPLDDKKWSLLFGPIDNDNYSININKQLAKKTYFGFYFQKVNYDVTYFSDGLDILFIFPLIFKSFFKDLEEMHIGEKYTFFLSKDLFDKVDPAFSFYPKIHYGITYYDISIDSYVLDLNDDSTSKHDTGYAKLWGPKIGVSVDAFIDTLPFILRGAITAEYTPYGEFKMTKNHYGSSLDKNRVYYHVNIYAGFRF